jgi:hypothetical protein
VSGLGQPPFDPRMMVALLLHGYASGLYSSRRIAKACRERSDFVMIVALDPPDFRTISDFRKRHLRALGALFLQVLRLCETAGLIKLGHVALDGTKIKAKPDQASADSGYCSEPSLEALEAHGVDGYVAPGRAKHPASANGKIGGPLTQRMRKKIDDGGFETPYRLRKQVVEPVFGQIKQARGFHQFLLRGVEKVRAEWAMICATHTGRQCDRTCTERGSWKPRTSASILLVAEAIKKLTPTSQGLCRGVGKLCVPPNNPASKIITTRE